MFKIIVSDLDGTLLSPNQIITEYTKKILRIFVEKGIHFVFATGRHHLDVFKIKKQLKIDAYMITSNGAKVHNSKYELIFSHNLNRKIAKEILKISSYDEKIVTNIFINDSWYIRKGLKAKKNFFHKTVLKPQEYNDQIVLKNIAKIYFVCEDIKHLLNLEKVIKHSFGDNISISFSFPACLEIIAGNVSKGHSLKKVANILGLSLKDCIAFGDGMNDLEMLKMVGKGCIMKNAHFELKKNLPDFEIIGSNEEDGVSKYLEKYLKKI